nr:ribonuclease H-like domain-containing protein [Chitinophagales bacterium]
HDKKFNKFVGHNIKEFDIPFICRRLLIHGLPIPPIMDIQGKKPWEVIHEDTLELWKFGDYKHYVSLDLLTQIFDIDSPKSDISGKDISKIYYETMDLERISAYCAQDIVAVFQVYQKLKQIQIPEYQVEIIA